MKPPFGNVGRNFFRLVRKNQNSHCFNSPISQVTHKQPTIQTKVSERMAVADKCINELVDKLVNVCKKNWEITQKTPTSFWEYLTQPQRHVEGTHS